MPANHCVASPAVVFREFVALPTNACLPKQGGGEEEEEAAAAAAAASTSHNNDCEGG